MPVITKINSRPSKRILEHMWILHVPTLWDAYITQCCHVDIPFTCLEVECSAIVCSLFISAHGLHDRFFLL